jgi:hypothetical protein
MSGDPPTWNNAAPAAWTLIKVDTWIYLENFSRTFGLHENVTTVTGTLHENLHTFMVISRAVLNEKFEAKVVEKIKTRMLYSLTFFPRKSRRLL